MTTERIEDFNRADKPDKVTSYHVAVMNVIMHLKLPSSISQETIAARAGCSQREVSNVFSDLVNWRWITAKSGARHQNTNWLQDILWENLPAYIPLPRLVISADAVKLAEWYKKNFVAHWSKYINVRGHNCVKPLPAKWEKRWSVVFQQRINEGYTLQEICDRITLLTQNSTNNKYLRFGPQNRVLLPKKVSR